MATLQDLINSVDVLQSSVTNLSTEVNVRKSNLDSAILTSQTARDESILAKNESEIARDAAILAKTDLETARDTAITKATEASQSAIEASTFASNALTSENNSLASANDSETFKNQAETFKNETSVIRQDILDLLPNFPNAFIFALNKRIIQEGAEVTVKLKYMRDIMVQQLDFTN